MSTRRGFGSLRKLPSGRYQASYIGPDGQRHTAPMTFRAKVDADGWLFGQRRDMERGTWGQPAAAPRAQHARTFAGYAERWLTLRESDGLAPGTLREYRRAVRGHLIPALGELPLGQVKAATVREWYHSYGTRTHATRAKAYRVLTSIMRLAVEEELITANPCQIRGASADPRRAHHVAVASPAQVEAIADAMPPRWRLMVLLGAWCQLRFGELAELRRHDVHLDGGRGVLKVRRAMGRDGGQIVVGPPKSDAGRRDVTVPPHLLPALTAHLAAHAQPGRNGLLFTTPRGGQLYHAVLYREWNLARTSAGLPELHFHDLRHAGATWLGQQGATTKELMRRLGHSTPNMAMRYQHAEDERDAALAERLSGVAPKRPRARKGGAA